MIDLDAQTAWFPLLTDSTLSASTTEDVSTHFTLALQFLKERTQKKYFFRLYTHGGAVLLLPNPANALFLQ